MPEMPDFSKSPPELVERFQALTQNLVAESPDVERRQMFGYPALFASGHHATGLFRTTWIVRLADADRAELLLMPGAAPFEPVPGRSMGGYVVLPPSVVADDEALVAWVDRAIAYGRSLPPKRPKPRAERKPR